MWRFIAALLIAAPLLKGCGGNNTPAVERPATCPEAGDVVLLDPDDRRESLVIDVDPNVRTVLLSVRNFTTPVRVNCSRVR
jgi:hypothetical protein